MNERAKIVDFYLRRIDDSNFDLSIVRKELESNGIPKEEIRVIIRLIDSEIQRRLQVKETNRYALKMIAVGSILTGLGVVITVFTYTGLLNMGNSFLIAWGPILAGLSIVLTGLAKRSHK